MSISVSFLVSMPSYSTHLQKTAKKEVSLCNDLMYKRDVMASNSLLFDVRAPPRNDRNGGDHPVAGGVWPWPPTSLRPGPPPAHPPGWGSLGDETASCDLLLGLRGA